MIINNIVHIMRNMNNMRNKAKVVNVLLTKEKKMLLIKYEKKTRI